MPHCTPSGYTTGLLTFFTESPAIYNLYTVWKHSCSKTSFDSRECGKNGAYWLLEMLSSDFTWLKCVDEKKGKRLHSSKCTWKKGIFFNFWQILIFQLESNRNNCDFIFWSHKIFFNCINVSYPTYETYDLWFVNKNVPFLIFYNYVDQGISTFFSWRRTWNLQYWK